MAHGPRPVAGLPPGETARLVRRYRRNGDPVAIDRLVRSQLHLVARIARQYRWSQQEPAELMQVGTIGLVRAIDKFDPHRGVQLSSYAALWIRALILRFVLENWRLVRVGTTSRQWQQYFRARSLGSDASSDEQSLRRHISTPELSLDAPAGESDDGARGGILACLSASDDERPDVRFERAVAHARVRAAIVEFAGRLEGRERRLFEVRWLVDEPRTLTSIGGELGVSRERAHQIERRLLGRLESFLERRLGDLRALVPALAAA